MRGTGAQPAQMREDGSVTMTMTASKQGRIDAILVDPALDLLAVRIEDGTQSEFAVGPLEPHERWEIVQKTISDGRRNALTFEAVRSNVSVPDRPKTRKVGPH